MADRIGADEMRAMFESVKNWGRWGDDDQRGALNLSTEPFFDLNTTAFQKKSGLDKIRNLVTISTPLLKNLTGEAGYMNQHGFVKGGPDTSDATAKSTIAK